MTLDETFELTGYHLTPGHFSSRILTTSSSDAKLFINEKPTYYLSLAGRLFQIPRGAQSDGISAPQIAAALGREHGGDDWIAGWFHDGTYRGWLLAYADGQWLKAKLSRDEGDNLLRECALACGDSEAEADTLREMVILFGRRNYQPAY